MKPEEYVEFDAMGLAALVHRGEVTPRELTEAAIERIEALNPRLNAVVERDYDGARAAAGAVALTAVPEASTWAMMLAGFGGLGFAAFYRSRRSSVSALA